MRRGTRLPAVPVCRRAATTAICLLSTHACRAWACPDGEVRRLRSYLRQRAMLVEYAAHHIQHMHNALTQMNVKVQHVIKDITGKTGLAIIEAIVSGERDPLNLARLRDPRIRADEATIARSLQGHWRDEHIFELTQALDLYRVYQGKIAECDREIEAQMERFEDRGDGDTAFPEVQPDQKPEERSGLRRAEPPLPGDRSGPDPDRRSGRPHGTEGSRRDRAGHDPLAYRRAFRILAGIESEQPRYRRKGHQLPYQALGETGPPMPCVSRPTGSTVRIAPWARSYAARKRTWERPRRSLRRPTSWLGSSTQR